MRPQAEIRRTNKIKALARELLDYIDNTDVVYDSGLLDDAMEHAQEIIDIVEMLENIGD